MVEQLDEVALRFVGRTDRRNVRAELVPAVEPHQQLPDFPDNPDGGTVRMIVLLPQRGLDLTLVNR